MTAVFSNADATGFQPYLRVLVPPQLAALTNGELFGEEISGILYHGELGTDPKADPNIPGAYPDRFFTGPEGYKYYNVNLPVGAMLPGEITLDIGFCATLNGSAEVNVPFEIFATPVFRYGNDPSGESAPAIGTTVSIFIEPIAYNTSFGASPSTMTPGTCWPVEHSLKVDVATDYWMNDLMANIEMPDSLVYNGVIDMTPGCSLTSEPLIGETGGTIGIECSNLVGTDEPDDVFITYTTYVDNVMDPNDCGDMAQSSWGTIISSEMDDIVLEAAISSKHFMVQLGEGELALLPGTSTTLGFLYFVDGYIDGITNLEMTFVIPDGLTYQGGTAVNGSGITGETVTVIGGNTHVHLNITNSTGNLPLCGTGLIQMDVFLEETRSDGSAVLARDAFTVSCSGTYDVVNGATSCAVGMSATISVANVAGQFEVNDLPLNGEAYVPGEMIDYLIEMEIPSEDAGDLVFEILFPVPIHDVADLDLTFGNDVTWGSADNQGIAPTLEVDTVRNALYINWGSVSNTTSGGSAFVSAIASLEVQDAPFALGLTHSAIAKLYSSNSSSDNVYMQFVRSVDVGAPELRIWHGAYQTDNPNATFESDDTPYDDEVYGIDGGDEVRFRITIKNEGSADAFNIIAFDSTATNQFNTCNLLSVTHPGDVPTMYSGDLFTSGLLIDEIERSNSASVMDVVYVDYKCWVKPAQYVKAGDFFEKEAIVDWAASPDATERYEPIYSIASGNLGVPKIEKTLQQVTPGYQDLPTATVGEIVTYSYKITLPEAVSTDCALLDSLSSGLSFEQVDSLEVMPNVFTSSVPVANLLSAVNFSGIGGGPVNERRRMNVSFGNLSNNNDDNEVDDFISFTYSARVLNAPAAVNNATLVSTAILEYEHGDGNVQTFITADQSITVTEPLLQTVTSLNDTELFPGEQTFITVTVSHLPTSSTDAFDLDFNLDLPLGLHYVDGSFLSECPDLIASGPTDAFGQLQWTLITLPEGTACQFIIGVLVDETFPACSQMEACMYSEWTSTASADAPLLADPQNSLGYERTGNTLDPGSTLNAYANDFCQTIDIVNDALVAPVIAGGDHFCTGQDFTLSIPEYTGAGVVYHWEGPDGELGINSHSISFNNVTVGVSGTYTAWVQMGDCTSGVSVPQTITITDVPEVSVIDVMATCLPAGSSIELGADVLIGSGPFDFDWSGPSYVSTDSLATILNASDDDNGVYTLIVEDAFGCLSEAQQFNVTVSAEPGTPGLLGDPTLCVGDDLLFETSNYGPGSVYHWSTPTGNVSTSSPIFSMNDLEPEDAGVFSVWVDAGLCDTPVSDEITVTVASQPATPEFSVSSAVACENAAIEFSTDAEADDYLWEGPNSYSSSSVSPPAIGSLSTLNQGTYTLQVWVDGCASDAASIFLNVVPQPAAPDLTGDSPICEGDVIALNSDTFADAYSWIIPGETPINTSTGSYEDAGAVASQSGAYSLSVFDGTCWSANADPVNIVVEAMPQIEALAGPDQVVCSGEEVLLESENNEGYAGEWHAADEDLLIASPEEPLTVLSGLEQGSSHLIYWSLTSEGCGVFATDSVLITTPSDPLASYDLSELKQGDWVEVPVLENDLWFGSPAVVTIVELPEAGQASVQSDQSILYTVGTEFVGTVALTYQLCLEDCPALCDTAEVRFEVLPQLVIPDVFTPNGDLVNDTFEIDGLERFPENELVVVNRWGSQVYAATDYDSTWNGQWDGKDLPEGTYFYVLRDRNSQGVLAQGYIIIKR